MNLNKGFTLIEILIAVSILAIVSVLSINSLNSIIIQFESTKQAQTQFIGLERALIQMTKDIMQMVQRNNQGAFSNRVPSFSYGQKGLDLLSGGWKNWTDQKRSNLQHIRYELIGDKLTRRTWKVLDPKLEEDSKTKDMLDQVEEFKIVFYNKKHNKVRKFSQATYLAIQLTLEEFGKFEYWVLLPDYFAGFN